jgi:hypothetical protein
MTGTALVRDRDAGPVGWLDGTRLSERALGRA